MGTPNLTRLSSPVVSCLRVHVDAHLPCARASQAEWPPRLLPATPQACTLRLSVGKRYAGRKSIKNETSSAVPSTSKVGLCQLKKSGVKRLQCSHWIAYISSLIIFISVRRNTVHDDSYACRSLLSSGFLDQPSFAFLSLSREPWFRWSLVNFSVDDRQRRQSRPRLHTKVMIMRSRSSSSPRGGWDSLRITSTYPSMADADPWRPCRKNNTTTGRRESARGTKLKTLTIKPAIIICFEWTMLGVKNKSVNQPMWFVKSMGTKIV